MMLVTGAAGKTGQAVVRNLVAQGAPVRAFVRTAEQATALLALGAAETVVGTFAAADDLVRACTGAATIYHICPNMHPDELQIGRNLLTAAQQTGVARCVYHSVLHPQVEAMAHHWQKLRVEELLFQSGLAYAIVQPAAYMQNVLANWPEVVATGVYRVPYAAHTRLGMVDLADVAAAVTRLLLEPALDFGSYELAGGEILTQDAVAAQMAAHLGRPVRCAAVDRAAWAAAARGARDERVRGGDAAGHVRVLRAIWLSGAVPFVLTQLLGRATGDLRRVPGAGGHRMRI
jgi:NAD(P)H dehydrogenase (quinone)